MPRPSQPPRRTPPHPADSVSRAPGSAGAGRSVLPTPSSEPSRLYLGFAYGFGVFAGLVLGVYGVFAVPAGPRIGDVLLSVGVAIALAGNAAGALLVRWLTGTRLGATILLAGWTPAVLWLAASQPEGDLLLQATTTGYLFLVVGSLVPVAVAVFGRARRGMTALPTP